MASSQVSVCEQKLQSALANQIYSWIGVLKLLNCCLFMDQCKSQDLLGNLFVFFR
ncbi:hypothetical protein I3843_02G103600 [Carya illinoinensis]|nr:hypothetical protein I3843_02G103600 [Carya illinoinensis]